MKCLLMMELTCINRTAKSITMNLLIDAIVKTLNKVFFLCVCDLFLRWAKFPFVALSLTLLLSLEIVCFHLRFVFDIEQIITCHWH